ncbi:MAG: SufD family Fe-S cluster assembly protein [Oscillospiraceae bacterium]|nr:SufD family Fe-S cluster assembly protein [Oscillospiraceae bacterium]
MSSITVNSLPVQTWNRLNINDAVIDDPGYGSYRGSETADRPEIEGGMGKEFNEALSTVAFDRIMTDNGGINKHIYNFTDKKKNALRNYINVGCEDEAVVIQSYLSDIEDGRFAVQNKIELEDNAKLTLVQVQKLGNEAEFCNDIGAVLGKNASFRLVQIVLSGKNTYIGVKADEKGDGSSFDSTLAYRVGGSGRFDVNYEAVQSGKKTNSNIISNGVLYGKAEKVFRGTIDFKEGSSGSKGAEKEDVLLMDETVVNRSIPIILCHEEDVEGEHGATIGKINDEQLFYMNSRGLPEKEVYKLLADARIAAAAKLIPDEETRKSVLDELVYIEE